MKSLLLLPLVLLPFASLASAASLVVNGSFEQGPGGIGSFNGWQTVLSDSATFVDSNGQTGTYAGQASDGLWSAWFGSTAASGGSSISQTLSTTPDQIYLLTFDLANDNGGQTASNSFRVLIGGTQVFSAVSLSNQDYARQQFRFTASGSSTALMFTSYNDFGYFQLDNVAVNAVPEPGTFGLLLAGTGLLLEPLARRRVPRAN